MANVAIVAFGPTQAGKSTTISTLCLPEERSPAQGDGSGESVTEYAEAYNTKLGLMIDPPGCNDSMLRFTNEEAGKRIASAILKCGANLVKFVVFESLANDSVQLRQTLAAVKASFGSQAFKGIVLLVTKVEVINDKYREAKLKKIRDVAKEQGLREIVEWTYQEPPDLEQSRQFMDLQSALSRLQAVNYGALEDLSSRQQKRAKELCEKQVAEKFDECYVEDEPTIEDYDAVESFSGVELRPKHRVVPAGGLRGLFGGKDHIVEDVPTIVPRTRKVTKQRRATRKVERKRTRELRLPERHFLAEALKQILEEDRQSVHSKVDSEVQVKFYSRMFQASLASEAMYYNANEETLKKYLHQIGQPTTFTQIALHSNNGTDWGEFFAEDLGTLYLAFRGTMPITLSSWEEFCSSVKDLVADASLWKSGHYDFDQMHHGFRARAENVPLDQCGNELLRRIQNCEHVVVTGHSLGAATAGCFSYALLDRFADSHPAWLQRFSFIGFGSPLFLSKDARFRISTKKWARCFSFVVNTINGIDRVATLPLSLTKFAGNSDWQRVGTYYFLQRAVQGAVKVEAQSTDSMDAVNIVNNLLEGNSSMHSHRVLSYRKGCADLCSPCHETRMSKL